MIVTIITVVRGDGEIFNAVVEGLMTPQAKKEWQRRHLCDEFSPKHKKMQNKMLFAERFVIPSHNPVDLINAASHQDERSTRKDTRRPISMDVV